ncbi:hypothetical protein TanjilG_19790 [Lupinus angustifolius]|uniref:Ribophorin II n=1 Tax=Lupinus angustifolius TaxID=3871 RepID=A0A1J7H5C1_LUPAN|nr:hypothetical protein TanjilG_19790 [Lupinus angustifolius]
MAKISVPHFLLLLLSFSICIAAKIYQPISDSHRSLASDLFTSTDPSYPSLEAAYEALRVFEVLGIEKKTHVSTTSCPKVLENLGSSSPLKDLYYALKVNGILKCKVDAKVLKGVASRLKATVKDASTLLDIYYSIGSLVLIKNQDSNVDVLLADADGTFHSIKALSQSDGRWRYSSDNPKSSTYAAGLALEALAGVISLASSEIDQSKVNTVKNDISKLFDTIEKYDDGTFYFDEKFVDGHEHQGTLSTTSSVVRGVTAFAAAIAGKINVCGLISIPLILSLPETVYSLTKKDQLKVRVTTALGSTAPPLTVKLVRAFSTGAKDSAIIESKIVLLDSDSKKDYATGGQIHVPIYVTGIIEVSNAEIAILDSDLGSVETRKTLDLAGNDVVSLSANHLQKLRFSFQLTTPHGHVFKPHQAFLKLRHETEVEHIFVVGNTNKKFEIVLVKISIPLILSLPETVYSLTKKDQLKVRVTTALGSTAPPLTVKLVRAFSTGAKDSAIIESKELQYDQKSGLHVLDIFPKNVDVGAYVFVFEIVLLDSDSKKDYATGGQIHVPIYVTGIIEVSNAEIAILDSDLGSVETRKTLDLAGNDVVSLSANHLQKLRFSFQLTTPHGHVFKPHQAFLKLRHETEVEHIFVVGNTNKKFEIVLVKPTLIAFELGVIEDFLGLVEKLFYLSGKYDIELTVGDAVMENSFLRLLGHVELDFPEAPEKASRPPPPAVDPYSRYGPKAEIAHIFRVPEKRPPQNLSLVFLGLILLPFVGFLIGLLRLGVNLKNFPSSTVPATFAILFQLGIGAVLLLYVLFWLKLDLFTTLKTLGFLGAFLLFVGHSTLSHLASTSAKLKSA